MLRSPPRTPPFRLLSLAALLACGGSLLARAEEPAELPAAAADVLVVCPEPFRAALQPWLAHRRGQGHSVALLPTADSAAQLREVIRAAAGHARYLLLVGDAPSPALAEGGAAVPVHHLEAKVNIDWGSEPEIATDNYYADLDGDSAPDLAVGRWCVDSAEETAAAVRKTLDYEATADFGPWRQRVNFIAGLGGFGPLIDGTLEAWAKTLITEGVPAGYATSMTYASWRSPYCPHPSAFHAVCRQRLCEGCLFFVYIGHGQHRGLDHVRTPGRPYPILESADVPRLTAEHGAPIALFLSCHAAAFDGPEDCLGEDLFRHDGGPVAVIGGSRVTMPYAMAVLGQRLLDECFLLRRATLGEMLLAAKRGMILDARDDERSQALDAAAAAISPKPDQLAEERLEHVQMFNLLGDPLLRVPHPRPITLEAPPTAPAGLPLLVRGRSDVAGRCTVELVLRRDRLAFRPPHRDEYSEHQQVRDEYQQVYERANDPRLSSVELEVTPGEFTVELPVPEAARGACHVRVFIAGASACALGACDVQVRRPR